MTMQSDAQLIAPRKPSRPQGPRHPFDRRTRAAKRHREIVAEIEREVGDALTEARRAVVDQLAAVTIAQEQLTASLINGEPVDVTEVVRLANASTRLRRELGFAPLRQREGSKWDLSALSDEQLERLAELARQIEQQE